MIASNTTQFFVSSSTRLRSALRRIDPYAAGSIFVLGLIIASSLMRAGVGPAETAAPIIVIATPALPSAGQHGNPARRLERAPIAARTLPTAIVPTAVPLPTAAPAEMQLMSAPVQPTADGYVAHTTDGDLFVPNDATPVPAGAVYTGPFLAPVSEEAPTQPRLCTGFGDLRDYDPAYAASLVCHQAAP